MIIKRPQFESKRKITDLPTFLFESHPRKARFERNCWAEIERGLGSASNGSMGATCLDSPESSQQMGDDIFRNSIYIYNIKIELLQLAHATVQCRYRN